MSRIAWIGSPLDARCAISTMAPFGIAVDQDIGLGVDQNRAADLLGPMIILRDPAQRRLNPADDDGCVFVGFAAALGIDDHRPVRPPPCRPIGCVAVIVPDAAVGGVVIDQRIHVPGGDAEEQIWLAQRLERLRVGPIGAWAMMPTRNPCASSNRPMIAMPKLG